MSKKINLNMKNNHSTLPKKTHILNNNSINHPELLNNSSLNNNFTNKYSKKIGVKNDLASRIMENKSLLGRRTTNQNALGKSKATPIGNKTKIFLKYFGRKKIIITVSLIVVPIILFLLFIIYIISSITDDSSVGDIAMGGYYNIPCKEVTVLFTDKSDIDSKTYPFEEYIAGVVAGEVGILNNIEVYKVIAVAARSFFLTHENNCTIESSDRLQVFRELTNSPTDELAIKAADATKGQVLLSNNELFSTQYDAFACVSKDDNYYTISQANQKIPVSWMNNKINPQNMPDWFICNGKENMIEHHGNGVSQYGSLYLAEEMGYTYDEILNFYLSEFNVSISSNNFMSSVAGLEVKDTINSEILSMNLGDFLSSHGSSIADLNNFIYDSVSSSGKGTRAGVVSAAVSLINYLYDNFNVRIPYRWNGKYQNYGVNADFGSPTSPYCPDADGCYYYLGFDCSGFVSWAIKNGGYNFSSQSTRGFDKLFSGHSCNIRDNTCIGQPGDLINLYNGHVMLIVAVDVASGKYMIAESSNGVSMREWNMHESIGDTETKILLMDEFYSNVANVDLNY